MKSLSKIEAIKLLGILDNSIQITTAQNKTFNFISFSSRDIAYKRIISIFKAFKKTKNSKFYFILIFRKFWFRIFWWRRGKKGKK